MKHPLGVLDRINLLQVLPTARGSVATLRIVQDLQRELSFSEEESAALEITAEGERITWRADAASAKDVEIGPVATGVIRSAFEALDAQGALTMDYLPLYERFVESKASA